MIWATLKVEMLNHVRRRRQGNTGTGILPINGLKCFTQMAGLSLKTGLGLGLLLFISFFPHNFFFWTIPNLQNNWRNVTMRICLVFTQIQSLLVLWHMCCVRPLPPTKPLGTALQSWLEFRTKYFSECLRELEFSRNLTLIWENFSSKAHI